MIMMTNVTAQIPIAAERLPFMANTMPIKEVKKGSIIIILRALEINLN